MKSLLDRAGIGVLTCTYFFFKKTNRKRNFTSTFRNSVTYVGTISRKLTSTYSCLCLPSTSSLDKATSVL